MIYKETLLNFYVKKKKSAEEIAKKLKCSPKTVRYWMSRYGIKSRSISDAIYLKCNPNGDPFKLSQPRNIEEAKLYGLGLGLYWGEGTRANKYSVRLGNTDPKLLSKFIKFLVRICGVKKRDLKFGLQIFTDINVNEALNFWIDQLKIKKQQIYKPTITRSNSLGTYRQKSKYGVLQVLYHNKKLRDLLVGLLPM